MSHSRVAIYVPSWGTEIYWVSVVLLGNPSRERGDALLEEKTAQWQHLGLRETR